MCPFLCVKAVKKQPPYLITSIPDPLKVALAEYGATPSFSVLNTYVKKAERSLIVFTYIEEHPMVVVTVAYKFKSNPYPRPDIRPVIERLNNECLLGTHSIRGLTYIFRSSIWLVSAETKPILSFEKIMEWVIDESEKGFEQVKICRRGTNATQTGT